MISDVCSLSARAVAHVGQLLVEGQHRLLQGVAVVAAFVGLHLLQVILEVHQFALELGQFYV